MFTIRNPSSSGIDTRQAQGGQFAQTVAGHSHRANTKGDEVSSHGVFQGEQGRLLPAGLLKVLLSIMEQQVQEVEVRCRCRPIHPLLDDGKGLVEIPPHSSIVCPLSGKYKSERRHWQILGAYEDPLLRQGPQRLG